VSDGECRVKKSLGQTEVSERHAVIMQAHQQDPALSIRHLCSLLEVNRAWYSASREENTGSDPEVGLRDAIELIVVEFPGYGYRRVTHALKRAGWMINHKHVLRIMREECLLCQLKRQFVPTTDSHHHYQVYPNLVAALELTAPNQAWVGDKTSIRLPSCFVYLAALLDAYSRRCVGWKLSKRIDTELALGALDMALTTRASRPGLIHHSDRGVQYASTASVERLHSVQAQISMSAVGNPYDNAKAESFFKTLKREEVYLNQYQTFAEAQANSAQFIEDVYNMKRLHSSLGYVPPIEFEEAYFQNCRV
jgi:transposase InsO family protein